MSAIYELFVTMRDGTVIDLDFTDRSEAEYQAWRIGKYGLTFNGVTFVGAKVAHVDMVTPHGTVRVA